MTISIDNANRLAAALGCMFGLSVNPGDLLKKTDAEIRNLIDTVRPHKQALADYSKKALEPAPKREVDGEALLQAERARQLGLISR